MEPNTKKTSETFLNRVSVYGLEFAVAMITLIVAASVLSFSVFALFNYLAYDNVGEGRGYFALWSSASTIVWVPVALIFYLRVRAYMARSPKITNNSAQRVFTLIYDVLVILTIISFAVAAVYAALTSLVKPDETLGILTGVAVPSAVSALIFGGALISFFKTPVVRRKTFALVLAILTALIVIPTIAVSVLSLRSANADEYKETDLYSIRSGIQDYYDNNEKLPESLRDIDSQLSDEATKKRLGEYEFKKSDATRYQLCADFSGKSSYMGTVPDSPRYSIDSYRTYANFNAHKAGENCYKLRVAMSPTDYRVE